MTTINAKLGDPDANCYVTYNYAASYFEQRRSTTEWDNLATNNKKAVLIEATRDLDRYNFKEDKYYDSQSLEHPRDNHEVVTGNCATPCTASAFHHSNLKSDTYGEMPDNYWKYGSVHITSGTPVNDIRLIDSSTSNTGTITTSGVFSATPTSNTEFIVFAPLRKEWQDAVCEQAIFKLQNEGMDAVNAYNNIGAESIKIGDVTVQFKDSKTPSKINISPVAKKLITGYIKRNYRVDRI